jgi:membrane protease subunit HflK
MPVKDPEYYVEAFRQRLATLGSRPLAAVIAVALLLALLWSTWFTVQPEETGVVQRFGAVERTVGPGLHFKLPAGIENVRLVPTERVLKEEFGFATAATVAGERTQYAPDKRSFKEVSLMLTGDLNVIDVQWIVQYRIEDPVRYLFQVRESQQTIRDVAEAVMRRVVGNRLGSDVLTVGRVAVSTEVKTEMQKILGAYDTGVRLVTVELQDVTPPDAVKPAFNECERGAAGSRAHDQPGAGTGQSRDPQGARRGDAHRHRSRGLRRRASQSRQRRGHALHRDPGPVPARAGSHAAAPVPGVDGGRPAPGQGAVHRRQ